MSLGQLLQSGDWKGEKHVPAITVAEEVTAGENFDINVCIGKEIPHPNELEHHIVWVKAFFQPEGAKFPIEIGYSSFGAHGESDVFTAPDVTFKFRTDKPGTIYSMSYCNIHGLWEDSKEIKVK